MTAEQILAEMEQYVKQYGHDEWELPLNCFLGHMRRCIARNDERRQAFLEDHFARVRAHEDGRL